ncbi:hypothetical protein J3R82DRAFT_6795, partial [Butyriboletus roseoflavus]
LVADVHRLPSLSRFLLPLPFYDLQEAVGEEPVIIVTITRANQNPVYVPLEITKVHVRELSSKLYT